MKLAPSLPRGKLKPRLVQLYGGGKRVAVIDLFRTGTAILKRLDDLTLVAHNAAFELSFLKHHRVQPGEMHCTMQACRLTLGEKQTALAAAAMEYLGVELDKTHQASDWSVETLPFGQIEYAAHDAVACWRIFHIVMQALDGQSAAYEIQMAAMPAVVRMQLRGFRLDTDAHAKLIEDLQDERFAIMAEYAKACADCGHVTLAAASVPSTPREKTSLLTTLLTQDRTRWLDSHREIRSAIDEAERHAARGPLFAHRRPDEDREDR